MLKTRELETDDKYLVNDLVILHNKAFPLFFLTQLGVSFLRALYLGYLNDADSGIIVAEQNDQIVGFIAYSNDYPEFFKGLIKRKIITFAWCSLIAVLRHPSFFNRLLGAFGKSESVVKPENYVELASICVDPDLKKQGIGTILVDYLISITDFNKYAYINLETDAEHNDGVNEFYQKRGFLLERQFITSEGRKMNEYRYYKR